MYDNKPKKVRDVVNVRQRKKERFVVGNPIRITKIEAHQFEGIDAEGNERIFSYQEFEVVA